MMKYSGLCWVEFIPESNTYKLGLTELAYKYLGSISNVEVQDIESFEKGQFIITASGTLGAVRVEAPMESENVLFTNTTQLKHMMARPLSLGPRGGWIVEFTSEDKETFINLSDTPTDI